MWGFLQSILLREPFNVTRSLKSNSADMLWCAHAADPARSATATPTHTLVLRLMEALLVPETTLIRGGSSSPRLVRQGRAPPHIDETVWPAEWLTAVRGSPPMTTPQTAESYEVRRNGRRAARI